MKPEGRAAQADHETTDKNLMPSMVVRRQRIQMGISANQRVAAWATGDEPGQPASSSSSIKPTTNDQQQQQQQQACFDQDGLVLPKRVLHHPMAVGQPIIRDLNRELKFNQVRGKNVLDQKSELKKALEKLEEGKRRKEAEQERLNRRTSLELRLEERAEKIAKETSAQVAADASPATFNQPMSNFSIKSVTR